MGLGSMSSGSAVFPVSCDVHAASASPCPERGGEQSIPAGPQPGALLLAGCVPWGSPCSSAGERSQAAQRCPARASARAQHRRAVDLAWSPASELLLPCDLDVIWVTLCKSFPLPLFPFFHSSPFPHTHPPIWDCVTTILCCKALRPLM